MSSFKDIAYTILKETGKPLHVKEITKVALNRGLGSIGKTPWDTMSAIIAVDIKKLRNKSRFVRTGPSIFSINKKWNPKFEKIYKITAKLSSKQKGDIAENRIAEIILLYGKNLACYKPISDDEGIDLIIKQKGSNKTYFIQVKSVWRVDGPVVAVVKSQNVKNRKNLGIVFCTFDIEEGEMGDYLWFVPADKFLQRARYLKGYDEYSFVAGRGHNEANLWNDFLIDKRDLGTQIIAQMEKSWG